MCHQFIERAEKRAKADADLLRLQTERAQCCERCVYPSRFRQVQRSRRGPVSRRSNSVGFFKMPHHTPILETLAACVFRVLVVQMRMNAVLSRVLLG